MNKLDSQIRKESSVSVQTRVSVIDLAQLHHYWMTVEGTNLPNMSRLISWSISALVEVIKSNGKLPDAIKTVSEAHRYLTMYGLYQKSLRAKSQSRISAALTFESMREHGIDPQIASKQTYNTIHSKHSIEVYNEKPVVEKSRVTPEMLNHYEELEKRDNKLDEDQLLKDAEECGLLAEDEVDRKVEEQIARNKEVIELENKEVDLSELPIAEDE